MIFSIFDCCPPSFLTCVGWRRVVRVYKGSGDRPGTPIRGQVIDRSHDKGSGDNPVTPAAAAGDCERLFGCLKVLLKVYRLRYFKRIEILRGGDGDV